MKKVLFVCLGNICRSPMAEGIFRDITKRRGLHDKIMCDSAGTSGYHSGHLPDERMRRVAQQQGIMLEHRARQFKFDDFYEFDYILAMDSHNFSDIQRQKPIDDEEYMARVMLMRDFDVEKDSVDVPDPYYGGSDGFVNVYNILQRSCTALLQHIESEEA